MSSSIVQTAISTLKSPKETLSGIVSNSSYSMEKKHFLFIILVPTWGILLSLILSLNIMALIMFPVAIGMMYHFAKRARDKYREHSSDLAEDDKAIYKMAFCFTLTATPGFVISVINGIISLLAVVGLDFLGLFSTLLSLISLILNIYFALLMVAIVTGKNFDVIGLVMLWVKALIDMILAILGIRTVFTVFGDYQKHFS